ncbi:unnamed protein product, partial [Closterium sp. NIES-53]
RSPRPTLAELALAEAIADGTISDEGGSLRVRGDLASLALAEATGALPAAAIAAAGDILSVPAGPAAGAVSGVPGKKLPARQQRQRRRHQQVGRGGRESRRGMKYRTRRHFNLTVKFKRAMCLLQQAVPELRVKGLLRLITQECEGPGEPFPV